MEKFLHLVATKITLAINSRTTIIIAAIVAFNALNSYGLFSPHTATTINSILGMLAVIFHVNPSQDYTKPEPQ